MDEQGRALSERERALARELDAFRHQLESDPLLPSAEMCRRLDAIADNVLALDQPADEPPVIPGR